MKFNKKLAIALFLVSFVSLNSCFAIVDNNFQQMKKNTKDENVIKKDNLLKGTILDATTKVDTSKIKDEETPFTNNVHSNFSLDDCIKIAIEYNPKIRSAVYRALAQKTKIAQAWSPYFPTLSVGVSGGRSGNSYSGNEWASASYSTTSALLPTISGSMMLFDFGKAKATADYEKKRFQSEESQTKEDINLLIYDIKVAYYNVLFAQAQVKVYEDTVKDYQLQQKQALRFYQIGKKAKIDVITADYNLGKARLNLVKAKNTLDVANATLAQKMGVPEYSNFTLTSQLGVNKYNVIFDNIIKSAYAVRPELIVAQKTAESAKMNLRAKKREYTPNIGISASYGNTVGTAYGLSSYQFGVGAQYSNLNILKTQKQISQAKFEYKRSVAYLDEVKHNLYLKVKEAYLDLETAEDAILIAKLALDEATEQYRQVSGRYKAGVGDFIELKDGENTYLNARLDFYNALLNYNTAAANLEKEIGVPLVASNEKVLKNMPKK